MDTRRAPAHDAAPRRPRSPTSPHPLLVTTVARGLLAAAVLLSAVVHLELWAGGMSAVAVVGPGFLVNAVGGLVIAVAVLLWRHWLPPAAALAFGAATLGAFVVSTTGTGRAQPSTTRPSRTTTGTAGSGRGAGPDTLSPVARS